jgi:hypothetical protein
MSRHILRDIHQDQISPWHMRFEDNKVYLVLEEFKLLKHLRDLNEDCDARESHRRLTFQSFHTLFPSFPILLSVRCRGRVAEHCSPAKLFRGFGDVFLMHYYLEVFARLEDEAQGRPIGVVVPFDGYRGGMVVHNGDYDTRTTKMTHPIPDDLPPHRVTVEPFHPLIKFLAREDWTPESSMPEHAEINKPEVSKEMFITPWMVNTLGSNSSLIVLAWLRKILLSESSYDKLFVRRLDQNERCVKATQEQIALETGLSERQVKRGLEFLRKEGLVEPVGPTCRSGFLLSPTVLVGGEEA